MVRTAFVAACLLMFGCLALAVSIQAQGKTADQDEIGHLMRKTWERPDAPLSVEPIVVLEGYAIAGWAQDDRGGRALLRKWHGAWDIMLCSGDHLRSPDTVTAAGAPEDLARRLVARLLDAEGSIAPALLTKFSLFDGVVKMDGTSHPHGHK